jgi:hypothetical protein
VGSATAQIDLFGVVGLQAERNDLLRSLEVAKRTSVELIGGRGRRGGIQVGLNGISYLAGCNAIL